MQITYIKREIPPRSTNTEPLKYELTLTACGNYEEIEWYHKQLAKVGADEEPIKIAILERLYKAVGICTVCGKHNCGHTGRVLPHILNRVDVLNAIDLEEKTLANPDKQ